MTATGGDLPDGLIAVVKRDCPTCEAVAPVLAALSRNGTSLTVFSQDDPSFPDGLGGVIDDRDLARSYRLDIETVPTIIRRERGRETGRALGWQRAEWESLTGRRGLGPDLPDWKPGCGSRTQDPGMAEILAVRFGDTRFTSRAVTVSPVDDPEEACFERGWSDGLPVVPPTRERVLRMLHGTRRDPGEVIGPVPPSLAPCTVEKVAINAVLAGCKPAYLPVVLAAVEAALSEAFCLHGLLCTTSFAGPLIVVNGPIARAIGMNSGINVLGQGNRANATIGRALQLVVRNVGGGVPGGIDRATFGNPGKVSFCFAEDEEGSCWEPLAVGRGLKPGTSAVSLYAGEGVTGVWDEQSREPESLCRSLAASLCTVGHVKKAGRNHVLIVVSPEHQRPFRAAGWSRDRLRDRLLELTTRPGKDLVTGAGGMVVGLPPERVEDRVPKFAADGLHLVHAGGPAGMMSAIIPSWGAAGARGTAMVTRPVEL